MKPQYALISSIHLFVVFLIFTTGVFFCCSHWAPVFRYHIAYNLIYNSHHFLISGYILIGISTLLFLSFYTLHYRRTLRIKGKPHLVEVNHAVISAYLQDFWKKHFPEKEISAEVYFTKDQKLEVTAHIPLMGEGDQESFAKRTENELGRLLREILCYEKEFFLILSTR